MKCENCKNLTDKVTNIDCNCPDCNQPPHKICDDCLEKFNY